MKIEKISENKIRIILKQEDFKDKYINVQELLLVTPDSQKLFLELLNRVKKEFDFDTDGHRLLIETYFQNDDCYIFTITKYMNKAICNSNKTTLKASSTNKKNNFSSAIYKFNNFDNFCALCNFLNKNINIKSIFKTSILYLYNGNYYLTINNINTSNQFIYLFNSCLTEFSTSLIESKNFESKLKEHGKVILKNNAIDIGIKYFA